MLDAEGFYPGDLLAGDVVSSEEIRWGRCGGVWLRVVGGGVCGVCSCGDGGGRCGDGGVRVNSSFLLRTMRFKRKELLGRMSWSQ